MVAHRAREVIEGILGNDGLKAAEVAFYSYSAASWFGPCRSFCLQSVTGLKIKGNLESVNITDGSVTMV